MNFSNEEMLAVMFEEQGKQRIEIKQATTQLAKTTEQFKVSVTSLNKKLNEPKDKTGELLMTLIDEQTKLIQSIMSSQEEQKKQMQVITSEIINLSNKQNQMFVALVILVTILCFAILLLKFV